MTEIFKAVYSNLTNPNLMISKRLRLIRLFSSVLIAAVSIMIELGYKLPDNFVTTYNTDKLFYYFPSYDFACIFLFGLPVLHTFIYNFVRVFVRKKNNEKLLTGYFILGDILDGIWTIYYFIITICIIERYRIIGMQTSVDGCIFLFSRIHILLCVGFALWDENRRMADRILNDITTPFCDSNGNSIYKKDHVYCNGIEYWLDYYVTMDNNNNEIDNWALCPLYKGNDMDMMDVINNKEIILHVKNDYYHKKKERRVNRE